MFDDDSLLLSNQEFFTEDGSLSTIFTTDAFMENDKTFYRPLQNMSFLIDVKLSGGMNVWMFHLTNVLLFSIIAFLFYFLLLRFNISRVYAFIGTLLYASHPLFVSAVAWIPSRGDLLLTLFSIAAFIFWIRFIDNKKYHFLILTWLFFTLALFSKETAAFLPLVLLLHFLIFTPKPKIDFKMILLGFLMLCTALVWLFLRNLSVAGSDLNLTALDFFRNMLTIPVSLAMFVVPYSFSTVPEFTLTNVLIGCVLIILLIVFSVKSKSQPGKQKIFYLLWFLLLLIPTFFAKTKEWDYLEHRLLLPLAGILMLVLLHIQNKNKVKVTSVMVALIVVFSVVTVFKTKGYENPVSFYEAVKHNKNKPEVYYFLKGNVEQVSENLDAALRSYNAAIKYDPNHRKALNNRGIIKQERGDFEGALADYNKAIDLGMKNFHIFKNRATVKMTLEDYTGAIKDYGTALEYEFHAEILYRRGQAYLMSDDDENALEDLDKYALEGTVDPEIFTTLGISFGQKNQFEQSLYCFTKAIETDSTYTPAFFNRAFAKYISADYSGALADCDKLLSIDSLYSKANVLKATLQQIINSQKNESKE